ncbi:MAG: thioredoxin domain-containing protein [Pseudomonadota bacterium]
MLERFGAIAACLIGILMPSAWADPQVRVLVFTADWCTTCRVLDPRIERSIRAADLNQIVLSKFDLTDARPSSVSMIDDHHLDQAEHWMVTDIWQQYQGRTGFAVLAAIDTGEALGCLSPGMDASSMEHRLRLAVRMTLQTQPGRRRVLGEDCPDGQTQ